MCAAQMMQCIFIVLFVSVRASLFCVLQSCGWSQLYPLSARELVNGATVWSPLVICPEKVKIWQ